MKYRKGSTDKFAVGLKPEYNTDKIYNALVFFKIYIKKKKKKKSNQKVPLSKNSSWLLPNCATRCYTNHAMFMQNSCHEHELFC